MSIQLCFAPKWYSYDKVTERKKIEERAEKTTTSPITTMVNILKMIHKQTASSGVILSGEA